METGASELTDAGSFVVVSGTVEVVVLVGAASIHDCRAIATAKSPKHRLFIADDLKWFLKCLVLNLRSAVIV